MRNGIGRDGRNDTALAQVPDDSCWRQALKIERDNAGREIVRPRRMNRDLRHRREPLLQLLAEFIRALSHSCFADLLVKGERVWPSARMASADS